MLISSGRALLARQGTCPALSFTALRRSVVLDLNRELTGVSIGYKQMTDIFRWCYAPAKSTALTLASLPPSPPLPFKSLGPSLCACDGCRQLFSSVSFSAP